MQYDFIINYSSYLGVLLIWLFLLFYDYLNNNIKRKNIILFFIMFIIYVVTSEIFYNTNIKYLYLNAKKYKDISYYTKLYKKNQFNEETLIIRTLAKYDILVKFYNGYFDCCFMYSL